MNAHLDFTTMNELLDGALTRPAADSARAHLMACAACAKSYAGLQGAAAAFSAARTPALSPEFDARVLAAARAPAAARHSPALLALLALAACAGAAWAAGSWLGWPAPAELAAGAKLAAAKALLLSRKAGLALDLLLAAASGAAPSVSPLQLCVAALLSAPIIVSLSPRRIK
jgi:hypothetical protein